MMTVVTVTFGLQKLGTAVLIKDAGVSPTNVSFKLKPYLRDFPPLRDRIRGWVRRCHIIYLFQHSSFNMPFLQSRTVQKILMQ